MAKIIMLEQCYICPGRFVRLTADNDQINPEIPVRYCQTCGEKLISISKIIPTSFDTTTGEPMRLMMRLSCPNWRKPKSRLGIIISRKQEREHDKTEMTKYAKDSVWNTVRTCW